MDRVEVGHLVGLRSRIVDLQGEPGSRPPFEQGAEAMGTIEASSVENLNKTTNARPQRTKRPRAAGSSCSIRKSRVGKFAPSNSPIDYKFMPTRT